MEITWKSVQDGVHDVHDYLMQVRYLDELVNAKISEREQLMSLATKITPEISDMPRGSGTSDKVGNISVKLADLARETNEAIDALLNCKQEAVAVLRKLDDVEYLVMHKYYIQGMTLDAIADDMHYHRVTVSNIKSKAIDHLKQAT